MAGGPAGCPELQLPPWDDRTSWGDPKAPHTLKVALPSQQCGGAAGEHPAPARTLCPGALRHSPCLQLTCPSPAGWQDTAAGTPQPGGGAPEHGCTWVQVGLGASQGTQAGTGAWGGTAPLLGWWRGAVWSLGEGPAPHGRGWIPLSGQTQLGSPRHGVADLVLTGASLPQKDRRHFRGSFANLSCSPAASACARALEQCGCWPPLCATDSST